MSATTIHQGPAYQLSLEVNTTQWGHHLRFVSFVPTARNPQPMERFQAHLSRAELRVLREAIDAALRESASAGIDYQPQQGSVHPSRSLSEPAGA